jgi:hypothetical protein
MVALSDAARLDRLEDAVREIRADLVKIGEVTSKNDAMLLSMIENLTPWFNACRVLLEDIRERLHAIDGR